MEREQETVEGAWEPRWYKDGSNGLRYWDGEQWTENRVPRPATGLNATQWLQVALAVCAGVLAAWAVILILANADPDTFFFPVKFLVEEAPSGF